MAAPISAAAPRQDAVIHERVTKGGRRLFYRLEVIQQPERARACGSGPKSSADRRPVDPPPVVELRVFEGGPTLEQSKDITFTYNANFFLFATLEHARVIAHGRVQTPAANTPPVLTGMPVSGMAYLDRPQEAGYFLFPDLSVRHEGRYRLSFNLYEQTKEDCDMDKEPSAQKLDGCESFDWRLEVKSNEFVVFSAKKFPGLTESTALSRTVAEQGCRVRIRRDVRMRRRDGKGGGDYDNVEDEFARRRRTQTPEAEREFRARSMSTESVQRTPYSTDSQRRPSGVDYPPPPPSFGGGSQPSSGSHLTFGGQSSGHYQPQPYPREHNAQSSSVPPSPSYPPPSQGAQYPHQPPQSHGYYQDRPPSQHYASADPSPRRDSHDIRRASQPYGRPITPLNVEKLDGKLEALPQFAPPSAQSGSNNISLPSIQSIAVDPQLQADSAPSMGPLTSPTDRTYGPLPPATHLGKRSRSDYNPTIAWNVEPQKNGTRPSEDSTADNPREFRRANGTTRKVYMSEYGLALF